MLKMFKKLYRDKFKFYLMIGIVVLGIFMIIYNYVPTSTQPPVNTENLELHFFFSPTCPHCQNQKAFNEILKIEFPQINFIYHDVSTYEGYALFSEYLKKYNIPESNFGVPATFFGTYHIIGFGDAETTGVELRKELTDFVNSNQISTPLEQKEPSDSTINLPIIGKIDLKKYSLFSLAVILGLIDGFNPCAMWVLVYLISLVVGLNDRKKIWLLVGSFVLASGILYFLFMTAWLNFFLIVGYLKILTIIVGLFAIYFGITHIYDYIKTKGELACDVGDYKSKQKTMNRIKTLISSPMTYATIIGIIGLAFVVNSIEFVCSSAIPAIFTQFLAVSNLSTFYHYLYILIYVFFFMLDDIIIFSLAAFAVNSKFGDKYAKYCKVIGGIILLILGIILVFFPTLLR